MFVMILYFIFGLTIAGIFVNKKDFKTYGEYFGEFVGTVIEWPYMLLIEFLRLCRKKIEKPKKEVIPSYHKTIFTDRPWYWDNNGDFWIKEPVKLCMKNSCEYNNTNGYCMKFNDPSGCKEYKYRENAIIQEWEGYHVHS